MEFYRKDISRYSSKDVENQEKLQFMLIEYIIRKNMSLKQIALSCSKHNSQKNKKL